VAFLVFAVLASAAGIAVVLIHNRRPKTMQSSIGDFERGLRALAPVSETTPEPTSGAAVGDGEAGDDDGMIRPEIRFETEADVADVGRRELGGGRTG